MYSMDELIKDFSLDRVSKSGAKFDYEKGKWFNHQYLMQKSDEELAKEFIPVLEEHGIDTKAIAASTLEHIVGLMKERVNFVSDLWEQCSFFFVAPEEYDEKSLKKRWKEESPRHMQELLEVLEGISEADWCKRVTQTPESTEDNPQPQPTETWYIDTVVMPWIASKEYGVGLVMNAFRICLVGAARGPHIWEITDVLGKQETLRRVRTALQNIH